MKAIAALALISLASASEDNELFKFDNSRVISHRNQTQADHIRHHPVHHNVTTKPKQLKPVRPILFNRTKTAQPNNRTRHFELPIHKPIRTFDDEELFLSAETADNELSGQGAGKWILPIAGKVAGKVLDKVLSKLDDDELFELIDNELMSKKMKQFLIANPQYMPPAPVANPEQAGEQAAPVVPPKKKGGPGKWFGRNKEWIAPIGEKVLDKILSKLDDDELFFGDEIAENELHSQGGPLKTIAPIAGKVLGHVLSKLDDDELFLETADNELMSKKMKQFLIANPQYMPPVAKPQPQQAAPAPVADPNAEQAAPAEQPQQQAAPAFVPKKKKGGPGKWIGRNKEWIAPIGGKILDKVLSALDDDELFLGDEIAENELHSQGGPLKVIAPIAGKVAGKVLDKILSKLDDDELFLGDEIAENELSGQGAGKWILPVAGKVAGKVLDKVLSKLDAEDFAENELHSQGPLKTIAPVAGKILGHVLSKLDAEDFSEDELHFLGVVGKETGKFFKKNGKTIASVGMKVLPALLLDAEEENELFNLGGLIKDGLNIYGDVKNKDYGNLINHGIQTVKDIKKHDDDELFSAKNKGFLGPL